MIDFGLYTMYVLMAVAVLAAIVLPLISAAKTPGSFAKSLYAVGGLVVLFVIAYAISSSEVPPRWAALGISSTGAKLVGAGLITFYITFALAIIGLIFSEINKALK